MGRISRGEMFMRIAHIVSARGTCDRAQVGAVIAHEGRVISIGYNGSAPGAPHCDDVGHQMVNGHCIRTRHAEVNAIDFANHILYNGDVKNIEVDLYVTHLPCAECCKYIASNNSGLMDITVRSVIYGKLYPDDISDTVLKERFKILRDGGVVNIGELKV